jgi:hypothetical protein
MHGAGVYDLFTAVDLLRQAIVAQLAAAAGKAFLVLAKQNKANPYSYTEKF